jgi:predicted exporter
LSANERFRIGLTHAGPSVTVTSVTNALAFLVGSLSTLPALKSLCQFAAIVIVCLYIAFLTIFSPWFINDLRR